MAFMGIFLLAIFVLFIIVGGIIIFHVALVIAIINLIQGINRHWPKKNIVLLSVFGSIALTIFLITVFILTNGYLNRTMNEINSSSDISTIEVYIALAIPLLGL